LPYATLRYEVEDEGLLVLTLDRPERLNAFTVEMADELVDAYGRAETVLESGIKAFVYVGPPI